MAQCVLVLAFCRQAAEGHAPAGGKSVSQQVQDHVKRRHDADGGQAALAHLVTDDQSVRHVRDCQRNRGDEARPEDPHEHLAAYVVLLIHFLTAS